MKAPLRLLLFSLLAGALVAGCGRNPGDPLAPQAGGPAAGSGAADDQAEVSAAMAGAPELVEDGQFESADETRVDDGSGGLAAIHPLSFFRDIRSVERRFEFAFASVSSSLFRDGRHDLAPRGGRAVNRDDARHVEPERAHLVDQAARGR